MLDSIEACLENLLAMAEREVQTGLRNATAASTEPSDRPVSGDLAALYWIAVD